MGNYYESVTMGGRKCGNTNRGKVLSAVKASVPEIYRGELAKEKTRAGRACVVDGAVLTHFQALPSSLTLSARVSRTVQLQMIWAGVAEQPVTRVRMGTLSARVKLAARSLLVGGAGCLALDQNPALTLTQTLYLCKGLNALHREWYILTFHLTCRFPHS